MKDNFMIELSTQEIESVHGGFLGSVFRFIGNVVGSVVNAVVSAVKAVANVVNDVADFLGINEIRISANSANNFSFQIP